MSVPHIEDGCVNVYNTKTGKKKRIKPHLLKYLPHLKLTPKQRRQTLNSEINSRAGHRAGITTPEKE